VVQALLETSKVDLNTKDRTGQTPLSWTSAGGHERVAQTLLATGKVDPGAKDHGGKLPPWKAADLVRTVSARRRAWSFLAIAGGHE
jgi:ankyrin repeat protein